MIQWPAWASTDERKRRWTLSLRTVLFAFGWNVGEPLDSGDRVLVAQAARAKFFGEYPTGDGQVTAEEKAWMHEQEVL